MTNTVEFLPDHTKILGLSTNEVVINVALDLVKDLTNTLPEASFTPIGTENLQALRHLEEYVKQKKDPAKPLKDEAPSPRVEATTERSENSTPNLAKIRG